MADTYTPCAINQKFIDSQEKIVENLKLTQKLPANFLILNPYATFKSYFDGHQKRLDDLRLQYKTNNCASDSGTKAFNRKKCLDLNKSIDRNSKVVASMYEKGLLVENSVEVFFGDQLTIALNKDKKDFIKYGCQAEVEASRQEVVAGIGAEYSAYDKARIQAESIYERNKRVFFGAVVLIGALALIMTFTNSKSKN